ncbi:hypothetical protein ACIQW5_11875 [Methylorubrum thiocyanatum]
MLKLSYPPPDAAVRAGSDPRGENRVTHGPMNGFSRRGHLLALID